jgi:hypothetical protein
MELKTESPVRAKSEPSSSQSSKFADASWALVKYLPSRMGKEHYGRNANGVDHGIIFFGTLSEKLHLTCHENMPHQRQTYARHEDWRFPSLWREVCKRVPIVSTSDLLISPRIHPKTTRAWGVPTSYSLKRAHSIPQLQLKAPTRCFGRHFCLVSHTTMEVYAKTCWQSIHCLV